MLTPNEMEALYFENLQVSSLFVSTLLTSIQLVINKYFNNSLAIYK